MNPVLQTIAFCHLSAGFSRAPGGASLAGQSVDVCLPLARHVGDFLALFFHDGEQSVDLAVVGLNLVVMSDNAAGEGVDHDCQSVQVGLGAFDAFLWCHGCASLSSVAEFTRAAGILDLAGNLRIDSCPTGSDRRRPPKSVLLVRLRVLARLGVLIPLYDVRDRKST